MGVGEVVEAMLTEQPIQARTERVTRCCRQLGRGDPHIDLSVALALPIATPRVVVHHCAYI